MNRLISTKLPSKNVYGFGENRHESFKHNLNYQNWPVFNRDEAPENKEYANLYGTQVLLRFKFFIYLLVIGKRILILSSNSSRFILAWKMTDKAMVSCFTIQTLLVFL